MKQLEMRLNYFIASEGCEAEQKVGAALKTLNKQPLCSKID